MPAGETTVQALSSILKTHYKDPLVEEYYKKAPITGMMERDENCRGTDVRFSLRYGAPQGGSFQLKNAIANTTSTSNVAFLLVRITDFQSSSITGEAIAAGRGTENTVYDALKGEMEGSMRNITRSVQICGTRNGGGQRGQLAASTNLASQVIQLNQPADSVGFEIGMTLNFSLDDGYNNGNALNGIRRGIAIITGLDRIAGLINVNIVLNTIPGITTADFIFRDGDYSLGPAGLARWIPQTAPQPGGSLLFGVDQSQDVTRLAGNRVNGGGGNKWDTLLDACELASREGATDLICMINNLDRSDLTKSIQTLSRYMPVNSSDGKVGYRSLMVEGPDNEIGIMADTTVPRGTAYLMQMDTWTMMSADPVPHLLNEDNLEMLRDPFNDGYAWRIGCYYNIGCVAPAYNTVITW
jgi:hypothetical protein